MSSTRSPRTTSARAGAVPSFLGYHGFTGTICASVNDEIVHGIPNPRPGAGRGRQHLHRLRRDPAGLARRLRGHGDGGGALRRGRRAAGRDGAVDVGRAGPGDRRWPADRHQRRRRADDHRRGARRTASSTTTAATASAPRCTRTRTCSTTGGPAAAPSWCPGLALAIEPMVTVGRPGHRRARRRLDRRHQGRLAGRALRAHRGHHARGPVGAHRRGRRRRRPGAVRGHAPQLSRPRRAPSSRGPGW